MANIKTIETKTFSDWMDGFRDFQAKARITSRIRKAMLGQLGDVEPVGEGVFEMRIHAGAGYRVYFSQRGKKIILLLCGGDKDSQSRDIKQAKKLNKKELLDA
jgi:putative addiction module killer protein